MSALVQPMPGLSQLTTRQVIDLDAKIRSLCVYTEATGDEVYLPIVIRAGKPVRIGKPILLEKFSPTEL
ncbi:MAG: hypothetical protein L6R45_29840 [Anaerolineae bacterium]|nr:hypothetical protein [Anaerolineae bacterium]